MDIIKRLSAVMEAVGGVSKTGRNQAQGFNFRGIDAVVNAVSPALRKEGVVVVPRLLDSQYDTVTVGAKQTQMGHARVMVEYAFYASDGSTISATVAAEAMDSGDKATAKAMSVAFRTALLQALCLPTDERDPDEDSYERTAKPAQKPAPAAAPKSVGAMTAARVTWAEKQIAKRNPDEAPMSAVSTILKRQVAGWSDVQQDEVQALIAALSKFGEDK